MSVRRNSTKYQAVFFVREMECSNGGPTNVRADALTKARRLKKDGHRGVFLKTITTEYEPII